MLSWADVAISRFFEITEFIPSEIASLSLAMTSEGPTLAMTIE